MIEGRAGPVPDTAGDPAYAAAWQDGFDACAETARAEQRRAGAVERTRRAGEAASRRAPVPAVGLP
ncbi:MAG: hypothetical protein AAGC57_12295 [Pseudomonadota bacterium]